MKQTTKQDPIETQIQKRKWGRLGNTIRKPANNITRQALKLNPQEEKGHQRNTWRRDTEMKLKRLGYNWTDIEKLAQNRARWRNFVNGLSSTES